MTILADPVGAEGLRRARRNMLRRVMLAVPMVVACQALGVLTATWSLPDRPALRLTPFLAFNFSIPFLGMLVGLRRSWNRPRPYDLLDDGGRRQVLRALLRGSPPAARFRPALEAEIRWRPWPTGLTMLATVIVIGLLAANPAAKMGLLVGLGWMTLMLVVIGWPLLMGRWALARIT